MDQRPLCRLCHEKHWGHEDHVWPDEPKVKAPVKPKVSVRTEEPVVKAAEDLETLKAIVEKRRAYMRDYMRRKRAKQV
jgi:hypothetical protein